MWLLGTVLGLVVAAATVWPPARDPWLHWVVALPATAAVLVVAVTGRVPRVLKRAGADVFVAVVGAIVAAVFGLALRYRYGWDARAVMTIAQELAAGRAPSQGRYSYLSMYPNNLPLLAIDRVAVSVSNQLGISVDVLLICCTALGFGLTVFAVHRLVSPVAGRGPAVVAQLAAIVLVGTSPWLSVPYTDAFVLPLVAGAAAVAAAALRVPVGSPLRRLWLSSLVVVLAAAAFTVKSTTVVLAAAGLIVVVLVILGSQRTLGRRLTAAALAVVLLGGGFLACTRVLNTVATQVSDVDQSRLVAGMSPPSLWWLANGMVEARSTADGTTTYGSYSQAFVNAIRGRGQAVANRYSRDYIAKEWTERGLAGTVEFYGNKAVWNWEDGMFSAWVEGYDGQPGKIIGTGPLTRAVEAVNGPQGSLFAVRSNLADGLWIGLLLVVALGSFRARPRREVVFVALTVLGIGLFTLVFQGRARYLFAFAPVVCALAGLVHSSIPSPRRRPDRKGDHPSVQSMAPVTTSSTAAKAASSP